MTISKTNTATSYPYTPRFPSKLGTVRLESSSGKPVCGRKPGWKNNVMGSCISGRRLRRLFSAGAIHIIVLEEEELVIRETITAAEGAHISFDSIGGPCWLDFSQLG
jgi:hypothetical protein